MFSMCHNVYGVCNVCMYVCVYVCIAMYVGMYVCIEQTIRIIRAFAFENDSIKLVWEIISKLNWIDYGLYYILIHSQSQ